MPMVHCHAPFGHSTGKCQRLSALSNKSQSRPWLAVAASHASRNDLPLSAEVLGTLRGATWSGWRQSHGRTRERPVHATPQQGPSFAPTACAQPRSLVQSQRGNASWSACQALRGSCAVAQRSSCSSSSSSPPTSPAPKAAGDAGSCSSTAAITPLHYAVVGGGLAGLSTAWHLIRLAPPGRAVVLHLYEAAGIAAGGSGAAAGLLHPYSPRGKVLWRGHEAFASALELVAAAEAAAQAAAAQPAGSAVAAAAAPPIEGAAPPPALPFVWRRGLVRPAASAKQAADFARATAGLPEGIGPRALTAEELRALVPGLQLPAERQARGADASGLPDKGSSGPLEAVQGPPVALAPAAVAAGSGGSSAAVPVKANRRARRAAAAAASSASGGPGGATLESHAGLLIREGVVLDVGSYLRALWLACQAAATQRGDGSMAELRLRAVHSLEGLVPYGNGLREQQPHADQRGPGHDGDSGGSVEYDGVVVAAGAAAATLAEVQEAALPLQLCQGLTLVMAPAHSGNGGGSDGQRASSQGGVARPPGRGVPYLEASPSLLGQPYLAAQGERLVVGATKRYGWTAEASLEACTRSEYAAVQGGGGAAGAGGGGSHSSGSSSSSSGGGSSAEGQDAEACRALAAEAARVWSPLESWDVVRVREGVRALPPRTQHGSLPLLGRLAPGRRWWLAVGLGSRGLVYHGLLGRLAAEAAAADSEAGLPAELTAWRAVAPGQAAFEAP